MSVPLENVRVLDASRVLAGPYAAMMLADLGADVVKVEEPVVGDQTRAWGPPFQGDQSAYYLSANRNKRSLTLNLKHPEGQSIFAKLIQNSDILLENFRPGTLSRLGFSAQDLNRLYPRLIHCAITGYGLQRPASHKPVYDLILQAESGWMSITGEPDRAPVRIGVAILDILAAHYAVQGVLAALITRIRTGQGQHVEIAMYDAAVASLCYMAQYYLVSGQSPARMGSQHPTIVPYQAFETQNGYVVVAVASQAIWKRFCQALGMTKLARDPRFSTNADRVKNRSLLGEILEPVFRSGPTADWVQQMEAHDIPAAPINDIATVMNAPLTWACGIVQAAAHPTVGKVQLLNTPLRFSQAGTMRLHAPPALSEHTESILDELGYTREEITRLRQTGVV
jgi:crotonobetainyl-CoA:carnitine CoA-transferase CaiB-like acyl-CoA transferase